MFGFHIILLTRYATMPPRAPVSAAVVNTSYMAESRPRVRDE